MTALTPAEISALHLLSACKNDGRALMPAGETIVNAHIPELLRQGVIDYHPSKRGTGYKLTAKGKLALA